MKFIRRKSSIWRNSLYKLGLVLGGGFFLYQIYIGLRSVFLNKVDLYHPEGIIISILLSIFITWYQMNLWGLLMNKLGVDIQLKHIYYGYVVSFLPRYIPGSFWGYLSRGEWLWKELNIPLGITALGSTLEIVLLVSGNIGWAISVFFQESWIKYVLPFLVPFISLLWLLISKRGTNSKLYRKLFGNEGAVLINKFPSSAWIFLLINVVIFWGFQGLSLLFVVWSFSNPAAGKFWSLSEYWQITASYCLAWFIGFIVVIIPSGIGLRELVLTKITTNKFSLNTGTASIISVIFRMLLALGEIFWVLVAVVVKMKNKSDFQNISNK